MIVELGSIGKRILPSTAMKYEYLKWILKILSSLLSRVFFDPEVMSNRKNIPIRLVRRRNSIMKLVLYFSFETEINYQEIRVANSARIQYFMWRRVLSKWNWETQLYKQKSRRRSWRYVQCKLASEIKNDSDNVIGFDK